MYVMGIDSGSTSTNAVIMDQDRKIRAFSVVRTGQNIRSQRPESLRGGSGEGRPCQRGYFLDRIYRIRSGKYLLCR